MPIGKSWRSKPQIDGQQRRLRVDLIEILDDSKRLPDRVPTRLKRGQFHELDEAEVLLVLDATTGQNAIQQATQFGSTPASARASTTPPW